MTKIFFQQLKLIKQNNICDIKILFSRIQHLPINYISTTLFIKFPKQEIQLKSFVWINIDSQQKATSNCLM